MSLTTIFDTKDSVFFVGGRGTKAGDVNAGGGVLKDLWGDVYNPDMGLDEIMGTNGEPLSAAGAWDGSKTGCTLSTDGTGHARFTRAGAFANCTIGLIANVDTIGVLPADENDRFEVINVDVGGNYVDVNMDWASGGTGDIKVGGAFNLLQLAADESTAMSLTLPTNVWILTNKDEDIVAQIDLDVGGGDRESNTHKRIVGIDSDGAELKNWAYVTIDANDNAINGIYYNGMSNITCHHIKVHQAGLHGYYFTGAANYGNALIYCSTTSCVKGFWMQNTNIRSIAIIGGYYEGTTYACYVVGCIGSIFNGVSFYSPGAYVCKIKSYGAEFIQCLVRSDGTGYGLELATEAYVTIVNTTFYNVIAGVYMPESYNVVVGSGNIFVVAVAATGQAYKRTVGSIIETDFECMWAMDGAPTASNRWGNNGLGRGSIEADPIFRNASNLDFRLKANSPCINTGRPTLGGLV